MTNYIRTRWMLATATTLLSACNAPEPRAGGPDQHSLKQNRAVDALRRAVRYEHAGSVRAQGIEAMCRHGVGGVIGWIRNGLNDEERGVRFAAAIALGTLRDQPSRAALVHMADGDDLDLRVAAYYALHRLGDTRRSGRFPDLLIYDPSPNVRRNTAMVLGLLGEPGAVKLLAKAMDDKDESVQREALEAMAKLGNPQAVQQLTFSASSGMPAQRVSAITALADLRRSELEDTFRFKLQKGEYVETRLAAARGLGMLGRNDGFTFALSSLDADEPHVKVMAAAALGAIGGEQAVQRLHQRLNRSTDPRVQVALADALLEIIGEHAPPTRRAAAVRAQPPRRK